MTFPLNPSGVGTANLYPTQTLGGAGISGLINSDPGFINEPIIFEPPPELSGNQPVIWIIATGASPNWGGSQVFMSVDNDSYGPIGMIFSGATQGILTDTFPSGSDPDTTNTLSVDISESGTRAQITTLPPIMADDYLSLCYVDGELISYSTATLTAVSQYDLLDYIRRGVYGTTISSHAPGTQFCTLTQLTMRQGYLPNLVGETIYLKFPSFNIFGLQTQSTADVPYYTFTLTGVSISPTGGGLLCPVDVGLAAGASEDWGLLLPNEPISSSCDWGLLSTPSQLGVDLGLVNH